MSWRLFAGIVAVAASMALTKLLMGGYGPPPEEPAPATGGAPYQLIETFNPQPSEPLGR